MKAYHRITRTVLLAGLLLSSPVVTAVEAICPDAELLTYKMITDLCWRCVMPIRIMGITQRQHRSVIIL